MAPPRRPQSSGYYHEMPDGTLRPAVEVDVEDDDDVTPSGPRAQRRTFRAREVPDPRNIYGLLYRIGEKWGFNALIAAAGLAMACGASYGVWKLVGWNRADQKVFVEAIQANTQAVQKVADAQQKIVDAHGEEVDTLKQIDDKLEQHLKEDEADRKARNR